MNAPQHAESDENRCQTLRGSRKSTATIRKARRKARIGIRTNYPLDEKKLIHVGDGLKKLENPFKAEWLFQPAPIQATRELTVKRFSEKIVR